MANDELIRTAIQYREKAYAPYSNFKVGAAVQGGSGKFYGGCNVENSSYGLTICAERTAIVKAVSDGETEIKRLAIVTSLKETSLPCGACRQVLNEFGRDVQVLCCDPQGNCDEYTSQELMPCFDQQGVFKNKLKELKKKEV